MAVEVQRIAFIEIGNGHAFGNIDNTSATNGQYDIDRILSDDRKTFFDKGDIGIGLDAGKL